MNENRATVLYKTHFYTSQVSPSSEAVLLHLLVITVMCEMVSLQWW